MTLEEPPRRASQRFETLDALRGLCALFVALVHFQTPGFITSSAFVRNSYIFVDYFFVLSGFVIAYSYGDRLVAGRITVGRYMGLRLGRIYPLHLAVLLAFLSLDLLLYFLPHTFSFVSSREPFTGSRSLPALLSNLFLLQSFGLHHGNTWNQPSWSIAAEVWTYLLFAIVCAFAPKRLLWWMGGLSFVALVVLALSKPSIDATYDLGFVRCVYGFGLGVLTFHLFRRLGPREERGLELAAVFVALTFVTLMSGRWSFVAPVLFACCIYVLAGGRGSISRLLERKPFQLLGLSSYSIYMIHEFIEVRFLQLLHLVAPNLTVWRQGEIAIAASPLASDIITLLMLGLLVCLAYLSYRVIERPAREFTRNLLNRRGETAGAPRTAECSQS